MNRMIAFGFVALLLASAHCVRAEEAGAKEKLLDGTWVFDAASNAEFKNIGTWYSRNSFVAQSKLVISNGKFVLPHYRDWAKDVTGRLVIDPSGPGTVDVQIDPFDLMIDDFEEKWSALSWPGTYTLDGDHLTICIQAAANAKRPTNMDPDSKDKLSCRLVRVADGFEFPKTVAVTVVDASGKGVPNATVFTHMGWMPKIKQPQIPTTWHYGDVGKCDGDGIAHIAYDEIVRTDVMARDESGKQLGMTSVSPAALRNGAITIQLQPECVLTGKIVCDELTKAGKPLGPVLILIRHRGGQVGIYLTQSDSYEFHVPAGEYTLVIYGDSSPFRYSSVTVPAGVATFAAPPAELAVSPLALLQGKPAPELDDAVAWKGKPTRFADLKGKYVLLNFWGYWCGPCVAEMPNLMELHERFGDKGLAIIGAHIDLEDGAVSTPDELFKKTEVSRKEIWKGKDIPFPVALIHEGAKVGDYRTKASATYGVVGYPTTILIDREGKVVGEFSAYDRAQAIREIEKLLGFPPSAPATQPTP